MAINETELMTAFVQDKSKWPCTNKFHVKQRSPRKNAGYQAFGVVTKPGVPIEIHDLYSSKVTTYATIAEMLIDGWIVD